MKTKLLSELNFINIFTIFLIQVSGGGYKWWSVTYWGSLAVFLWIYNSDPVKRALGRSVGIQGVNWETVGKVD